MAIADMYDKISTAIDENKFSLGIFIDLSKAFDTLDHTLLIKKLEFYGIRGLPLKLFESYLSNRKQYVVYNDVTSNLTKITCGVPQGSILGPLLFILYINDISNASNILHFILFADDTNLFLSNNSFNELILIVNKELSKLSDWFRTNRLSLNVKKTNFIVFGSKRIPLGCIGFKICIDGVQIGQVEHTKFLGVYIDEKLNWQKHITHISSKLASGIGIINRVKNLLPLSLLRNLYFTMIYPYLTYCNIIWGGASMNAIKSIITLQKRVVRIITGSPYLAPSSPIFARLQFLKFVDIRRAQTIKLMFKFKFNLLPEACKDFFRLSDPKQRYEIRKPNYFVIPFSRTEARKKSINVFGPELWNALPTDLHDVTSLTTLMQTLNRLIVSEYN